MTEGDQVQETYPICLEGRTVGQAEMVREGLYCRFRCRCRLPGGQIHRVFLEWDEAEEPLGVLAPSGGEFCLDTRIPAKRLGRGTPRFRVGPKQEQKPEHEHEQKQKQEQEQKPGEFVPLVPDQPFSELYRLKNARFVQIDGKPGIFFEGNSK